MESNPSVKLSLCQKNICDTVKLIFFIAAVFSLLPLSRLAAPAPLTRGATAWLKFLDLCVDEKRQEIG